MDAARASPVFQVWIIRSFLGGNDTGQALRVKERGFLDGRIKNKSVRGFSLSLLLLFPPFILFHSGGFAGGGRDLKAGGYQSFHEDTFVLTTLRTALKLFIRISLFHRAAFNYGGWLLS